MTVGETLTEARSQAGLSVEELSERTKIRGTVIRSIEEDDFEACGGDLYVRGYVRAIAGAVGIDAQPLIREFDAGRRNGASERVNGSTGRYARGYPSVTVPPPGAVPPVAPPSTGESLPRKHGSPSTIPTSPLAGASPGTAPAVPSTSPVVAGPGPVFPSGRADQEPAQTAFDLPAILTKKPEKPAKAEPKPDADAAPDNDAKPDTDAAPETDAAPGANVTPDADAVSDTGAVPDVDANSDANAVSDTDTDTDTDANAVPDTGPDPDPDLGQTRFDMVAVTSFDLPLVPDALPPAGHDADQTAQVSPPDFPVAGKTCEDTFDEMIDPGGPVPSSTPAPVPPAAVPRGTEDTRFDLPAVPEGDGLTEAMSATPADRADAGTQIFPVVAPIFAPDSASEVAAAVWSATGRDGREPDAPVAVDAAPERKRRRGLVAVAGLAVLIAVVGVGLHFATGSPGPAADAAVGTSTVTASAPILKTGTSASASGSASASAGNSTSASGSPTSSAGGQNVTRLRIASVAAFGPGGVSNGDDQADARNAIAADPARPWGTQWYATPAFGGLKVGTGLLFDMGDATVTSVHMDLAPEPGGTLEVLVDNTATPGTFTLEATTSDIAGATTVTLRHPVAARYLLIWFTQLPPNGQGQYMESVSGVTVTGRS